MGTSIHAHVEVKKDGQWHHYHAPIVERNYELFGMMAGVRAMLTRDGRLFKPVASIKGLPEDISLVTKVAYEQDKGKGVHHESVLTAEDIVKLQDLLYWAHPEVVRTGIDELDLEYSIFRTYINGNCIHSHQGWDDVRIVCWFDN